tara:strand:- start:80 stop:856 length:777 start_codon:yes stop_codon:yes gene_type:complete
MKIFSLGEYKSILNIDHKLLIKYFSESGVLINKHSKKSNVGHINIDGFSIRTILKSNNEKNNSNIFKKNAMFPINTSFRFALSKYFNNTTEELNRVRTIHRLLYKTIPLQIRDLNNNLIKLNKLSPNYHNKKIYIENQIKEKRIYTKELRYEFKYRKKIAYRCAKLLIPSIYIIKKRKHGIIQAKWIFLGIEQKRIHLGMIKNIRKFDDKKLRNLTIKIINKNYGSPFDKLSFTWIDKETKRLKKWQNTINNKSLIYK